MVQSVSWLVVIGDLVESRTIRDRGAVQGRLAHALAERNAFSTGIASPYTLTLGDEFQAVLNDPKRVFQDSVHVQAALHPVLVRFSLALGELTTEINPRQALGMDGPAFHEARAGIDTLKRQGALYRLQMADSDTAALANAALALISHNARKWQTRRFRILAAVQRGEPVPDIARSLSVSEQAVYKNIADGGLRDVLEAFEAIGWLLDRALQR